MSNNDSEIKVEQTAGFGSSSDIIGVQNNYEGLSAEDATRLFTNLFLDNFPRMQQIAKDAANERFQELKQEVFSQLESIEMQDYRAFEDVDVQYSLYEAQKQYARFGSAEKLKELSGLVVQRIAYNNNAIMKMTIDKAIEVVPFLSKQHVDLLSFIFACKHIKFGEINTINDLTNFFNVFFEKLDPATINAYSYLNSFGCLEIDIGSAAEKLSNTYHIDKSKIEELFADKLGRIHSDYGLSYVGIIIAIINLQAKLQRPINPQIWIHE